MARVRAEADNAAILDLFVRRVEELLALRLVTSGQLAAKLTIKGSVGGPMSVEQAIPDEEDLRSFLLTFRQLVSDKEPVFLPSVANILWTAVETSDKREILAAARARYQRALRHGTLGFEHNGRRYSPEATLRQWINGHYFHNDPALAEQLRQRAADPIAEIAMRHAFMDILTEATRYAEHLARCTIYWRSTGILSI